MKFFFLLGLRYGRDSDPCSPLSSVYGPYEDDRAVEEALARLWPNDKSKQFIVFDAQIFRVKPSARERPEHEKREPGDMANYVKDGDSYKCKDCGGAIFNAKVLHSIHLHHMPGAGPGQCQYESIFSPYCPNCEKQPNCHNAPIYG